MKIGFVAEPYEESHASGMGFVVSELFKNMLVQGAEHEFTVYSTKPVSKDFIPGTYRFVQLPSGFIKKLLWFYRMPDEVDVLLFVAPLLPLIVSRKIHPIIICQELASQKIRPEGFVDTVFAFVRDHILMLWCIRRAAIIVAASEATRRDLREFYRVPENKMEVVYDGYQDLSRFAAEAPAIAESLKPYFFFAGKVKYRKNVHGIAAAFVEFKKRTRAPAHLIIAGDYGGAYYDHIMKTLYEAGVEKDVHFVGYISGPQLYAYYKNALAVMFPSFNEGFGMPTIEAMSVGTPVITSNISSMAEAAGDAALLVDPYDTAHMAGAMERIYTDKAVCEELRAKGYERAKQFSWPKAAREFLAIVTRYAY